MNNFYSAYNVEALENRELLLQSKKLHKSNFINDVQMDKISAQYKVGYHTPSILMRIFLFVISSIGISSAVGLLFFLPLEISALHYLLIFLYGITVFIILERIIIVREKHYRSGVTESAIYSGAILVSVSLSHFLGNHVLAMIIVYILISSFIVIRYLNATAVFITIILIGWFVFQLMYEIGGIAKAMIPFAMFILFSSIYFIGRFYRKKIASFVFDLHLNIVEGVALLGCYFSVNYLVVRELSVLLMEVTLEQNQDISYSILFYFFTVAIPFIYLVWGIRKKSLLLIRLALTTLTFTIFTIKYYHHMLSPAVSATIVGAFLILISIFLFRYLRKPRKGFISKELVMKKGSGNFTAFLVSQTLGGHAQSTVQSDGVDYGGGEFGGGGSGSEW